MEDLKLKEIYARNYKGFESIKVNFSNRDQIDIIGPNGSGKTTLKSIIQACCGGVSMKGSRGELVDERFRVIGKHSASADVISTFEDVKSDFTVTIANHITKASNAISITASDGRALTKEWLRDFFNFAFMSAESFLSHTSKEQALLLGIDTSEYDAAITEIKAEYTEINRGMKSLGNVEPVEKVEPVDVHALYAERDRINAHNKTQGDLDDTRKCMRNDVEARKDEILDARKHLAELNELLTQEVATLNHMPNCKDMIDLDEITDKLNGATARNDQAKAYDEYVKHVEAKTGVETKLEANRKKRSDKSVERLNYITGFRLPFKGLSIDEKGGLLLDDRRINSFSTGEQINIVAKLLNSQNPLNKTVWIDEYERLDDVNKMKVARGLIEKGYRVITSEVGSKKKRKGSILLEGCAIVGDDIAKEEDDRPTIL